MIQASSNCPCISGHSYQACCQPLHNGQIKANSAEQLMCSRYSAFCLKLIDYLVDTLHPKERSPDLHKVLEETIEQTTWLGLKVLQHISGNDKSTVEFVAYFKADSSPNAIGQMHELSHFVKQDNRWFYVNGDLLPPIKLARNELCFCGSAKKLKKCHLK